MFCRPALLAVLAALAVPPAVRAQPAGTPTTGADPVVALGWPGNAMPKAPDGFLVSVFAKNLDHPRGLHVLANGDVLVSEAGDSADGSPAGRITLLRDTNKDGTADARFVLASGLARPFGLAVGQGRLFVAGADAVTSFPFRPGQTAVEGASRTALTLSDGSGDATRDLQLSLDERELFVGAGEAENSGTAETPAGIRAITLGTGAPREVARGLADPAGLDDEPASGILWSVVRAVSGNQSSDALTSITDGGAYGSAAKPGETALVPDYPLGATFGATGLRFYRGKAFPAEWRNGAFIALRGAWDGSMLRGAKVIFVPFRGGRPQDAPRDFLLGFVSDPAKPEAFGRPVGLATLADGSLLVSDDAGDTVWRVAANAK